jgi:hypothetical protein
MPRALVVKNASKMRSIFFGSMPAPLRLEAAKLMLEQSRLPVEDIAREAHFKKVKQRLRADALDAVVADFAERP